MLTVDPELLAVPETGGTMLDIGCGEGRHSLGLTAQMPLQAWGVDLSEESLRTAHQRYQTDFHAQAQGDDGQPLCRFAVADAAHLPFADESFDLVVCSEVLEHLPDYQPALAEMRRVLKPTGVLAITVPRFYPEWICWKLSAEYPHQPGGHVRIFTTSWLKRDVCAQGFNCYARHWAHGLHSPWWWLQCLLWKNKDRSRLVRWYHRFLVWDLMKKPLLTRVMEAVAAPLMGKSVALYFRRDDFPRALAAEDGSPATTTA